MVNNTLQFKIIGVCFQNAEAYPPDDADFFLEQDDWNDYWYYTTYHLHATSKLTGTKCYQNNEGRSERKRKSCSI